MSKLQARTFGPRENVKATATAAAFAAPRYERKRPTNTRRLPTGAFATRNDHQGLRERVSSELSCFRLTRFLHTGKEFLRLGLLAFALVGLRQHVGNGAGLWIELLSAFKVRDGLIGGV